MAKIQQSEVKSNKKDEQKTFIKRPGRTKYERFPPLLLDTSAQLDTGTEYQSDTNLLKKAITNYTPPIITIPAGNLLIFLEKYITTMISPPVRFI